MIKTVDGEISFKERKTRSRSRSTVNYKSQTTARGAGKMKPGKKPPVETHNAVIIMFDARGFSRWSEQDAYSLNAATIMARSIEKVKEILSESGASWWCKSLGDGGLYVSEYDFDEPVDFLKHYGSILASIHRMNVDFEQIIRKSIWQDAADEEVKLGWAVSKGRVFKIPVSGGFDYYSPIINKVARLCDKARPSGVILTKNMKNILLDYEVLMMSSIVKIKNPIRYVDVFNSKDVILETDDAKEKGDEP